MAVTDTHVMELTVDDLKEMRGLVSERALTGETILLNMGPQHPSTHGVLRLLLEIDGENRDHVHAGYWLPAHRHREDGEDKTYMKVIPLTDRMDYLVADDEQSRLRDGGRKVDGRGRADARAVRARDPVRTDAHHQPPGLAGHARASTSAR